MTVDVWVGASRALVSSLQAPPTCRLWDPVATFLPPEAYPDQGEGLQPLIVSIFFLAFCLSHDLPSVPSGEWGFQEALGPAVTAPAGLGKQALPTWREQKMSFPKGCCRKQEKQEGRVGFKTTHHKLEMSQ